MRRSAFIAMLDSACEPVNVLHNRLIAQRDYIAYWVEIDSQIWRMEKALNDKYDTIERRIRIVDAVEYFSLVLYQVEENKPVVFKQKLENEPVILYTISEASLFSVDFIVQVSIWIPFDMREIRAFIDTFKTPSKTYSIQIV